MEKNSVTKRKLTIRPDGSTQTTYLSARFMDNENIRHDIDSERAAYAAQSGVQAVEEAHSAYVLTVTYASGTVQVITYSDN